MYQSNLFYTFGSQSYMSNLTNKKLERSEVQAKTVPSRKLNYANIQDPLFMSLSQFNYLLAHQPNSPLGP